MNKDRKSRLSKINTDLENLKDALDTIMNEEEEAFGNLPESIQDSDRGQAMQDAIDNLAEVTDSIQSAFDSITSILES
jgi:hypothetical protein